MQQAWALISQLKGGVGKAGSVEGDLNTAVIRCHRVVGGCRLSAINAQLQVIIGCGVSQHPM